MQLTIGEVAKGVRNSNLQRMLAYARRSGEAGRRIGRCGTKDDSVQQEVVTQRPPRVRPVFSYAIHWGAGSTPEVDGLIVRVPALGTVASATTFVAAFEVALGFPSSSW